MFAQDRLSVYSKARSPYRPMRWLMAVLAMLAISWSDFASADDSGEFLVQDAHAWSDAGLQMLDARFVIRLSSGAREALENGVPLVLELHVQLVKTHKWFWDSVEVDLTQRRQLEYHALSRSYLVKSLNTGTQSNYRRLEDALLAAGTIQNLVLTDVPLQPERSYIVRIRGNLDVESLPTPVRLLAYVSSAWDMQSEWYAWQLVR
jgi:hypothetical protein